MDGRLDEKGRMPGRIARWPKCGPELVCEQSRRVEGATEARNERRERVEPCEQRNTRAEGCAEGALERWFPATERSAARRNGSRSVQRVPWRCVARSGSRISRELLLSDAGTTPAGTSRLGRRAGMPVSPPGGARNERGDQKQVRSACAGKEGRAQFARPDPAQGDPRFGACDPDGPGVRGTPRMRIGRGLAQPLPWLRLMAHRTSM